MSRVDGTVDKKPDISGRSDPLLDKLWHNNYRGFGSAFALPLAVF